MPFFSTFFPFSSSSFCLPNYLSNFLQPRINAPSLQKIRASIFTANRIPIHDFPNSLSTKRNDRPLLHFHSILLSATVFLPFQTSTIPPPKLLSVLLSISPETPEIRIRTQLCEQPGDIWTHSRCQHRQREGYSNGENKREEREREGEWGTVCGSCWLRRGRPNQILTITSLGLVCLLEAKTGSFYSRTRANPLHPTTPPSFLPSFVRYITAVNLNCIIKI